MAGLVPAIHAVTPSRALNLWPIGMSKTTELSPSGAAWMAGTSPICAKLSRARAEFAIFAAFFLRRVVGMFGGRGQRLGVASREAR